MVVNMQDPTCVAARLSDVVLRRMGQGSQLGRYPFHPHRLGDVTGRVEARSCVVDGSFNRAFALHDVRGMMVTDNVAYNVAGHAFFLEDGTETGNTITGNLALRVKPQFSMLATDTVPAGFWITNTNNTMARNAAADVVAGVGYWVEPQLGAFVPTNATDPARAPVAAFVDNSVHAVDQYGASVRLESAPSGSSFVRFSAYGCAVSAFMGVRTGVVRLENFSLWAGATAALEVIEALPGGGLFGGTFDAGTSVGVVVPGYLDAWVVDGAAFSGSGAALSVCAHCNWVNTQTQGVAVTHLKRLTFAPGMPRLLWAPYRRAILRDADNSMGAGVVDLVAAARHLTCPPAAGLPDTLACPAAAGIAVFGAADCALKGSDAFIAPVSDLSRVTTLAYGDNMLRDPTDGWAAVVQVGTSVAFWLNRTDWVGGVEVEADDLPPGGWLVVRMQSVTRFAAWSILLPDLESFNRQGETFCVKKEATELNRLPLPTDTHGAYYHDVAAAQVHILFRGVGEGSSRTVRAIPSVCARSGCVGPAAIPMAAVRDSVSRIAASPSGDVVVPADKELRLTGNLVVTGTLYVVGALTVVGTASISAANIVVYGAFTAINQQLTITLTGTSSLGIFPPPTLLETGGTFLCAGLCTLHGTPRVPWTRLATTGGSPRLAAAVDWERGNVVAVSTGADVSKHTLTAVSGDTITFTPPLSGVAGGSLRALDYGLTLDTRPEVALLNRSIQACSATYLGNRIISVIPLCFYPSQERCAPSRGIGYE